MKVHLWGELGFYGPGKRGRFDVPIDREVPLAEALRRIGVPSADVAVLGLNGEVVRLDDPAITVADGDRIDCFPATSGGGRGGVVRPVLTRRVAGQAVACFTTRDRAAPRRRPPTRPGDPRPAG